MVAATSLMAGLSGAWPAFRLIYIINLIFVNLGSIITL